MEDEMDYDYDQEEMPRMIRRRKKLLYESIRERMEFYFSDANLSKDRYLSQIIKEDPQVDLSIFLRFNRILQLTSSLHDLKKALKKSEFLELNDDKTKVFRRTPIEEKPNVDACTIYVEQLSWDMDHDWLKQIFSRYGKVDYVSIPKYKNTGKIKGFAFVEFATPEIAKAALEEFEKEGCCLTSSMNPEKLCSIATFEEDKHENKNQLLQHDTNKNKFHPGKISDESEVKVGTKRKFEEAEEEDEEEPEGKKRKNSDLEPIKKTESEEDINPSDKNKSYDKNVTANEVEVTTKKKKNRKKKKSLKTKPVKDVKMYGLQILSKADWKRLRNKYLNVQKEKMKKLKLHLHKNQLNYTHKPHPIMQVPESVNKPRFEFTEGVIVKVAFDEPVKDSSQVNQFKCDARRLNKIEYVDVAVGSKEGYMRFSDANAVQEVMNSKPWENMSVLEGKEEEEYWERIKEDRSEKFENKNKFKKKRGRSKILDKAEKLMSKRIRLSVDE